MKTIYKFPILFILFALFLVPTGGASAQGPNPGGDGRVIFGSNFTLEKGETFDGDLVVFGGNVTVEEDAALNGSLVVFGGTVRSNGNVSADVVIIGGQVSLEEKAVVAGDVVTIGGQLQRAEGATIKGDVVNDIPPDFQFPNGQLPPVPGVPKPSFNFDFNPIAEVFWIFFWAVIVSGFAMLLSLFWQPQIERAGTAIVSQPLTAGAIGLLAVFVGLILILTIIPPVIVAFAWLFGLVALGSEVGERFTKGINQTWSPVLRIGFGTFLLMLVAGAIGLVPCLGGFALFLLGLLGIGGTIITWFGTRPLQSSAVTVYTPPTNSAPAPPASQS